MRLRLVITLLSMLLAAATTVASPAAEPLVIPAILPITGPAAFIGTEFEASLRVIESNVNAGGGVNGRPIRFSILDDQSNPQVDVQLTNQVLVGNPPVIIDGGPLAMCKATVAFMKSTIMWCLTPSIRPEPGSSVYAVTAATRDGLSAALDYFQHRGLKRVAVLNGTDATGADADAILDDLVRQPRYNGMALVAHEHFNVADLSVAAQLSRIKAANPQALISFTTGTPIATVLRGLADAGLNVPVFTSPGNMSTTQLNGYKGFLSQQLLFPGYAVLDANGSRDKQVQQRIAAFRAACKAAGLTPDLLHAFPWDPVLLTVDAMKHAGPNASGERLRDALAAIKSWPGLFGRYDFTTSPNRGLGLRDVVVLAWDPARSVWTVPE